MFGGTLNSESLAFGSSTFGAFSSVMMEHTGRFKSHSVNPSTSVSSSQEEAGLKVGVVVRFRLLISFIYLFFINKVFVFACVGFGGQSFGCGYRMEWTNCTLSVRWNACGNQGRRERVGGVGRVWNVWDGQDRNIETRR